MVNGRTLRPSMSPTRLPEIITGRHRAEYGVLVAFENAAGQVLTLHRVGPPMVALRQACIDSLSLDPSFRVTAYSTPQTIWQDLQGRGATDQAVVLPEAQALSRIGMNAMLHPRLVRSSAERYHRYRRPRLSTEMPPQ